ncbi:hypothetical protein EB151_12615, partial [archaeon]|nr:hypothetical protein [archaeon]
MSLMTTPTNPTGPSNGVISMNVSGGIGPYTYSVDGGVTFSPFPIFNNLTPGTYNVVAKDSNGNTVTDTVTLVGANTTTYSVGLITTTATLLNSPVRQTKQYTSVIRVIPSLPDGAVLNFDLVHVNSSNSSPYYDSAIVTTNSVLTKNSTTVPINSTSTNTGTTINTLTACQNQFTYYTGMTDLWGSVSYNNTTTLQLVTTTTVFQNNAVKCYIGTSVDTFTIT